MELAANEMTFVREKTDDIYSEGGRGTDALEDSQIIILHCQTYQ